MDPALLDQHEGGQCGQCTGERQVAPSGERTRRQNDERGHLRRAVDVAAAVPHDVGTHHQGRGRRQDDEAEKGPGDIGQPSRESSEQSEQ